jgi:serine protease Do
MTRKQILYVILAAFLVGTLGNIFFNRLVFPRLSTVKGFSWVGKLQSSSPIVISRREEVRLNEGVNLIELTKQAQTVVVSIYSKSTQKFLGNGIIITSDGVVFTTKEVLAGNNDVIVVNNEGAIYQGLVRAMDPKSPLAAVTVVGRDMPTAQFYDSKNMQTAQRIFALGKTTEEFTREFATGMVTKTLNNNIEDRTLNSDAFETTITTDAKLSADFVGGPVVNLQGLIIGVVINANGQILTAEAIDGAVRTYLAGGKITRPFFGFEYSSISSGTAKVRGLPSGGASVSKVEANGPAAKAGLIAGDYVVLVNGGKVEESSLEQLLIEHGGSALKLTVNRGSEQKELTLTPEVK